MTDLEVLKCRLVINPGTLLQQLTLRNFEQFIVEAPIQVKAESLPTKR